MKKKDVKKKIKYIRRAIEKTALLTFLLGLSGFVTTNQPSALYILLVLLGGLVYINPECISESMIKWICGGKKCQ